MLNFLTFFGTPCCTPTLSARLNTVPQLCTQWMSHCKKLCWDLKRMYCISLACILLFPLVNWESPFRLPPHQQIGVESLYWKHGCWESPPQQTWRCSTKWHFTLQIFTCSTALLKLESSLPCQQIFQDPEDKFNLVELFLWFCVTPLTPCWTVSASDATCLGLSWNSVDSKWGKPVQVVWMLTWSALCAVCREQAGGCFGEFPRLHQSLSGEKLALAPQVYNISSLILRLWDYMNNSIVTSNFVD